jgi:hypothetical protein
MARGVLVDDECDWWDGFLHRSEAEEAKRLHEATGEAVEGPLRRSLPPADERAPGT